jgi:hypothetical protein
MRGVNTALRGEREFALPTVRSVDTALIFACSRSNSAAVSSPATYISVGRAHICFPASPRQVKDAEKKWAPRFRRHRSDVSASLHCRDNGGRDGMIDGLEKEGGEGAE